MEGGNLLVLSSICGEDRHNLCFIVIIASKLAINSSKECSLEIKERHLISCVVEGRDICKYVFKNVEAGINMEGGSIAKNVEAGINVEGGKVLKKE